MKILNIYSGLGGNRKLWTPIGDEHEITAVEYNEEVASVYQSFFVNDKVIICDAHEYLLEHHSEYDFIWSSPPCPSHSRINIDGQQKPRYPDMKLYEEIIFLSNNWFKGKWVVENVIPYYKPLVPAKKIGRHLYWSNFNLGSFNPKDVCSVTDQSVSPRFGFDIKGTKIKDKRKSLRNLVDPEIGQYILNCAMDIITKQNEKQTELF